MGDEFEDAKGKVFVSVYPSNLKDKDGNRIGKCVGKVKKNVASVEQLVSRAKKGGIVMSAETLLYAAQILSKAARDALSEGLAVDLLGLGTLGFSVEGSVDQFMTSLEIAEHFRLAFTPSKMAEKALKNILPSRIVLQNSRIYISEVKSLAAESAEKNTICLNRPLCIKGNGLKVGGEVCGVFLVPCHEQNVYAPRSEWIPLPNPYTNTPKKLELYMPDDFNIGYDGEPGEEEPLFCIAVVTSLNPNSRERAECVEVFSEAVRVRRV